MISLAIPEIRATVSLLIQTYTDLYQVLPKWDIHPKTTFLSRLIPGYPGISHTSGYPWISRPGNSTAALHDPPATVELCSEFEFDSTEPSSPTWTPVDSLDVKSLRCHPVSQVFRGDWKVVMVTSLWSEPSGSLAFRVTHWSWVWWPQAQASTSPFAIQTFDILKF